MPQGDACRFSHVLPPALRTSLDPPQPSPAHLLGLQRLSAGPAFEQQQQQPGAGGLLSFGAPGAAAFAGAAGGSGSAGGSRSGTPEIRLAGGPGSSSSGSTPSIPLLHQRSGISVASGGGGSGFSVAAPVFSPRDPGLAAVGGSGGGYGGLPAHLMAEQFGSGGGYGSRPGSAANSGGGPREDGKGMAASGCGCFQLFFNPGGLSHTRRGVVEPLAVGKCCNSRNRACAPTSYRLRSAAACPP